MGVAVLPVVRPHAPAQGPVRPLGRGLGERAHRVGITPRHPVAGEGPGQVAELLPALARGTAHVHARAQGQPALDLLRLEACPEAQCGGVVLAVGRGDRGPADGGGDGGVVEVGPGQPALRPPAEALGQGGGPGGDRQLRPGGAGQGPHGARAPPLRIARQACRKIGVPLLPVIAQGGGGGVQAEGPVGRPPSLDHRNPAVAAVVGKVRGQMAARRGDGGLGKALPLPQATGAHRQHRVVGAGQGDQPGQGHRPLPHGPRAAHDVR